jgi:hypothetical protein
MWRHQIGFVKGEGIAHIAACNSEVVAGICSGDDLFPVWFGREFSKKLITANSSVSVLLVEWIRSLVKTACSGRDPSAYLNAHNRYI